MEYVSLTEDDQRGLMASRLRELEVHHFQFTLEEREEPGMSVQRTQALADLERRIYNYRDALGVVPEMESESPEKEVERDIEL